MNNVSYMTSFHLRRFLPERVKVMLRLVKLGTLPRPPSAPQIPQELLNDCRFLSSREAMLNHLPKNGIVGEVGTLFGDFSRNILAQCTPQELHLFDLDISTLHADVVASQVVKAHEGFSVPLLNAHADNTFDWIYIDGDHTYKGVKADIEAAMLKIKPGGYMVFNDFAKISPASFGTFGVHQAVCEFVVKHQWKFAYFCFQGNALYDVALQRPV